MDILFVNLIIEHIEVNHQLIVVVRPIEVHLAQRSFLACRREIQVVGLRFSLFDICRVDQRLHFAFHNHTFGGLEDTLVIRREDFADDTTAVLLVI